MWKKLEYRAACGSDEWQMGLGGKAIIKLFPLHRACALAQVKDTSLLAAGFFFVRSTGG